MGSENFHFFKNLWLYFVFSDKSDQSILLVPGRYVRVLFGHEQLFWSRITRHWPCVLKLIERFILTFSRKLFKNWHYLSQELEISRKTDEFKVTSLALKNLIIKYFDYYKLFKIIWIIQKFFEKNVFFWIFLHFREFPEMPWYLEHTEMEQLDLAFTHVNIVYNMLIVKC